MTALRDSIIARQRVATTQPIPGRHNGKFLNRILAGGFHNISAELAKRDGNLCAFGIAQYAMHLFMYTQFAQLIRRVASPRIYTWNNAKAQRLRLAHSCKGIGLKFNHWACMNARASKTLQKKITHRRDYYILSGILVSGTGLEVDISSRDYIGLY